MASKRPWKQWFGMFIKELNGTSGLTGVGGAILAIISHFGLNLNSGKITNYITAILRLISF
ncbi:MAG: hypothetical protein ACRC2S_09030 [Waterburya sp.]